MFGLHVELQLEDLNVVPCSHRNLLLTHLDHVRFQLSTVVLLRIQEDKARLPLTSSLRSRSVPR